MSAGLVDPVDGRNDHGEVGDGVPELGDIPGHRIVLLTPVEGGGGLAPETVPIRWCHVDNGHWARFACAAVLIEARQTGFLTDRFNNVLVKDTLVSYSKVVEQ